jgi:hypothetical protein
MFQVTNSYLNFRLINRDHGDVVVGTPAFCISGCISSENSSILQSIFFIIFLNLPSAILSCHIQRYVTSVVEKQSLNERRNTSLGLRLRVINGLHLTY